MLMMLSLMGVLLSSLKYWWWVELIPLQLILIQLSSLPAWASPGNECEGKLCRLHCLVEITTTSNLNGRLWVMTFLNTQGLLREQHTFLKAK